MTRRLLAAALVLLPAIALADAPKTGAAAFGDWRADRPGVQRWIRAGDLPAAYATESVATQPDIVARPKGRGPRVPPASSAELVADGLNIPRVLRIAPNGDIFVAESGAGQVRVLPAGGGDPVVFAKGLNRPYGIAFYPPGPDPQWVYVAEHRQRRALPLSQRRPEGARREPRPSCQTSAERRRTRTRDIAFSPDGKTHVRLGRLRLECRARRMAEKHEQAESPTGRPAHGLGAAWGNEKGRADVLAFDPDGQEQHVFATGIRNCVGLAVQPGDRRALVRHQRARRARRQSAARLRDARQARAPSMAGPGTTSAPTRTRATRASGPISPARSPCPTC